MSNYNVYSIEKIKKKLKKKHLFYYYLVKKDKDILIAKGDKIRKTKNIVKEKIKNKPKKYEKQFLKRIQVKIPKKGWELGRPKSEILVILNNYQIINSKIKSTLIENKSGAIWFPNHWIRIHGWNKDYIKNIVKYIRKKNISLSRIGCNSYNIDFYKKINK